MEINPENEDLHAPNTESKKNVLRVIETISFPKWE